MGDAPERVVEGVDSGAPDANAVTKSMRDRANEPITGADAPLNWS